MKFDKLLREIDKLDRDERWKLKQHLAGDSRYYGDGGTIHGTMHLDVETHCGTVNAVWFRCQMLPFEQHENNADRATDMEDNTVNGRVYITGVEVLP